MSKQYLTYINNYKEEPYYTQVDYKYFLAHQEVSNISYVKRKLGMNEYSKITATGLLEACKKFPEVFAYWMLGIRLRPYQMQAIDTLYENNDVALAWSRRTGKSTIVKIQVLHTAVFNLLPGTITGTTWNIILQDQDIANSLYIEPLHEMMEKGDKIVNTNFKGALGENFFTSKLVTRRDKFGKVRANQITLITETGVSRINTLPPTNKAIGREGNIAGDEIAKWKDNPKVKDEFKYFDQIMAIKKDNPKLKAIFLSTPEGDADLFAKEIFDPNNQSKNNNFVKVWFPYWARTDEQWLGEMKITREKAISVKRLQLFQQEYEAKFITISDPYFDLEEHINKNITKDFNWRQAYERIQPCSIGIDWGGSMKSRTVICIYKWTLNEKDIIKPINIIRYEVGEDLDNFEKDVMNIKKNYNVKFVTVDNKGGRWMIPRLQKIFGAGRVIPFNFAVDKVAGYELFREALGKNQIELPNYTPLINEMRNFNQKLKPSSTAGTDDCIDACMMAAQPFITNKQSTVKVWKY